MPTKPTKVELTNSTAKLLNAIKNNATTEYRDYVPYADGTAENFKEIGAIILSMPNLQNEFVTSLVNRIGKVIVTSKTYENPWSVFKAGVLENGEVVENIFVNTCKAHVYDAAVAEDEVFKREIPDVRAAFHPINYQQFYKQTIQRNDLRQAFISVSTLDDFITRIISCMVTSANLDEFLVMKYALAKNILNGRMYPVTVPEVSSDNAKTITKQVLSASDKFTFMSTKYNQAGVNTFAKKGEQYLICTPDFKATMNVDVLATAFNMDRAEFSGHVIEVDGFGDLDDERLNAIFAGNNNYTAITAEEKTALNTIPAILVDVDYFQIYDNLLEMNSKQNEQGLYWNYFYHTWKTFSVSPFANAVMFIPGTPGVTSVTVSPSAITIAKGQGANMKATVVTTNFAPQTVTWTSSNEKVKVSAEGIVDVAADATGTATITATSVYDTAKTGTATVTVEE